MTTLILIALGIVVWTLVGIQIMASLPENISEWPIVYQAPVFFICGPFGWFILVVVIFLQFMGERR